MVTKLQKFAKRNRGRNARLYVDGLCEGYDYVVCPISKERLSMIRDIYIVNVLGMKIEDYPDVLRVCRKRSENIKHALREIDEATGLTKYKLGQVKARETLSRVDQSGISGYKKKGEKTRATHMANVDATGRNGYARLAATAIIKGNTTKASKGLISLDRNEFRRYKLVVGYLTDKHRNELSSGYITGLAGVKGAWHLDHKFSILKGYQQKISPFVIGHRANLEMIPWEENVSKHAKCSISMIDLLNSCDYSAEKSLTEFNSVIKLITEDLENNTPPNAAFLLERWYETNIRS